MFKKSLLIFTLLFVGLCVSGQSTEENLPHSDRQELPSGEPIEDIIHQTGDIHDSDHHVELPAVWSVIPFVLLLLMIATGPLFYPQFWHKNYPFIAIVLGMSVMLYYVLMLENTHSPIHSIAEYIQFIALLAGLFIASGGILIIIDKKVTPRTNIFILAIGAVIANIIGTTGASMLLIRPFIRLNKNRIKPYHIVFFIFIVSNVGGCLTPIGDPPLFLGFLKGIPFSWTLINSLLPWALAVLLLLLFFYFYDIRNTSNYATNSSKEEITSGKISLLGSRNFAWLGIVVISVFIDPNIFSWVPAIHYDGQNFSYIREIIMFVTAASAYKFSDPQAIKENKFSFEPIREVAFLFIGIFFTMMPALDLISFHAQSEQGSKLISSSSLYWGTGMLSGFLDNAPTYVNFLTASMASVGADVNNLEDVKAFATNGYPNSLIYLMAISVGAVFFGALTYIGNGPNFMVKSIAEQVGIRMPTFFGYIVRYSVPILLPILIIIWLLFFLGR